MNNKPLSPFCPRMMKPKGKWFTNPRAYQSWAAMKDRCYNDKCPNFKNYGLRGINVCDRWKNSFDAFLADMGDRPKGLTLERKDTNGNYEPDNCIWADRATQRRNQRDCVYIFRDGVRKTVKEWADALGMNHSTILRRKRRGLTDEECLRPVEIEFTP